MNNTCTLWQLLSERKVVIPRVQRDYAQGRKGKEYIRSSFLGELRQSLESKRALTLDFVYGNTENGTFYPLDGQQRLTTLWLLHWYIAFRLGILGQYKDIFKNFSYHTRASSSTFCESLCDRMIDPSLVNGRIADFIREQPWFFSKWMQDPTISSMLRTISGECDSGLEDSIEALFGNDPNYLADCWKGLVDPGVIRFELMTIGSDELPISDDLYIKMNARGKPLSNFENLKADWISHIRNNVPEDAFKYSTLIDIDWTDVFWEHAAKVGGESFNGKIDDMFFMFINRFVFNKLISPQNEQEQRRFDKLYGSGLGDRNDPNNDSLVRYEGFELYGELLGIDSLKQLESIFDKLKDSEVQEAIKPFPFIPQYDPVYERAKKTEQKDRIYFHAISLFLQAECFDLAKFKKWMRVVKNLTENAEIDNIHNMITCLKLIDGVGNYLSTKDWLVYEHLGEYVFNASSRLHDQWNEEIEKASQIGRDQSFEDDIIDAENYGFFDGTIRFLYLDECGTPAWDLFRNKLNNAKSRFDGTNKVPLSTVEIFLKAFDDFTEKGYFFTDIGYHARDNCWKTKILCESKWYKQVHELFSDTPAVNASGLYLDFINSGAVHDIFDNSKNYKFRYYYERIHCDKHPQYDIYVSDDYVSRHRILMSIPNIEIINRWWNGGFIEGENVDFNYNGIELRLTKDNKIHKRSSVATAGNWANPDATELITILSTF